MISVQEEQKGLPRRDRGVWVNAKRIAGELSEEAKVAIVRCEAGRSYSRSLDAIDELKAWKLLQRNAWRPSVLGRCVVEVLCR